MITKINKKLAQQIVNTVKDVCGYDINFIDNKGTIFASTNSDRIGSYHEIGLQAAKTGETIEVTGNDNYKGTQKGVNIPIFHNEKLVFVIGISGEPQEVRQYAYLAIRITKLLIREQEMEIFNRSQKEKMNYIVRSLVKGEVINREYLSECLKDIQIDEEKEMRVILIQFHSHYNTMNVSLIEQKVTQLFTLINAVLYTYDYPNEYIAILNNEEVGTAIRKLEKFAGQHKDMLNMSIGSSQKLFFLEQSYEACQIALKSLEGKAENFLEFEQMDIEIILGSLSPAICEKYLKKTVGRLDKKDKELLEVYFEKNRSLKNTCDKLFMHKNTLQYRLDRIGRITGYNPRKFEDAVVLYIGIKL